MELVKLYNQKAREKDEVETFKEEERFIGVDVSLHSGSDIVMMFNGKVIGTVNTIAQEEVFVEERSEMSREVALSMRGARVSNRYSHGWYLDEEVNIAESRAERRKKESVKKAEITENKYRKDVRKMMGGTRKWS